MKIIFPVSTNPFFSSNAISNRYESLITGLLNLKVAIDLIVIDGYIISNEKYQAKLLEDKYPLLKIEYFVKFNFSNKILIRLKKYIFDYYYNARTEVFLVKRFNSSVGFIFLTGNLAVRNAYLKSSQNIHKRGIIEFSEFQNIVDLRPSRFRFLISKFEHQYSRVTFILIKLVPNFIIMTKKLIPYYKELANNPHSKFIHLPMTVNLERFQGIKLALKEFSKPYISFVGVMNDAKDGVSILIKAFYEISNKYPQLKLFLVGPWQYETPKQLLLIKSLGLENRVFWMKEYPRNDIPNIICNSSLLVLPRPDSKQAQGGFPTKLGEYLATGNPVCATRVGEIPDYLTDNESVFFAEPGSVESFAKAMDRALSDPENAKRVGENGRRVAEREFNKDVQARKLFEFLKELNADNTPACRTGRD